MLAKRIIPCLDVKNGVVVKGVQFGNHKIVGDIIELATYYSEAGADELVFYDITASSDQRTVDRSWIKKIAQTINIPFCVAGGIRNLDDAEIILNSGADKISINSPALENPNLINQFSKIFGKQCVVVGVDSLKIHNTYKVLQYTGDNNKTINTERSTLEWICEAQERGAGEIVVNCMNQDGMRQGYDIQQLKSIRQKLNVPLIASGGAGKKVDFLDVFQHANVDGALAASVFHTKTIDINDLKQFLKTNYIEIRI